MGKTVIEQGKIYENYPLISDMQEWNFDGETAWALYELEQEARKVYEFQDKERSKIYQKYSPKPSGNGKIELTFHEGEYKEFLRQIDELNKMTVEMEHAPVNVMISPELRIKPAQIEQAKGIINFYRPETIDLEQLNKKEENGETNVIQLPIDGGEGDDGVSAEQTD